VAAEDGTSAARSPRYDLSAPAPAVPDRLATASRALPAWPCRGTAGLGTGRGSAGSVLMGRRRFANLG